jgi:feruloyl-CoA synthase
MAVEAGITALLFAPPSIVADQAGAGDGSLLLRSTEPLGDYPVTVVHSVRAWAAADPGRPLVAERTTAGTEPAPPGVIVAEGTRS